MSQSIGIVIPAYQPNRSILSEYVRELHDQIEPATIRIELDDASDSVQAELGDLPATVNAVSDRRGKGAAITAGFEALETEILVFADADGSTPADELSRVIEAVTDPGVSLAVGSRRHPDATVTTSQSPSREYLGDAFAWVARQLLDVSLYDYQCGAKAITAESWQQVSRHLTCTGFEWDIDLIAVAGALGYTVREVPIEWHDHPDSTVPPIRTSIALGRTLLSSRAKVRGLERQPRQTTADGPGEPHAPVDQERPHDD
ncbi:glycosyltransferase [Halobacteriaceae archaeon SHR40]|uniref:glycosyltransferase n=1 Tax=Halovenus amylolytica TaxID=2500550 RepID=UPI000FE30F22